MSTRISLRIEAVESDSSFTNGAAASESMCRTGETRHARRSGAIWPMRLGTSSPITIEKYVSSTTTSVMPTAEAVSSPMPSETSHSATGLASADSPKMPERSPMDVMPT